MVVFIRVQLIQLAINLMQLFTFASQSHKKTIYSEDNLTILTFFYILLKHRRIPSLIYTSKHTPNSLLYQVFLSYSYCCCPLSLNHSEYLLYAAS